jgi:glycine/D-amino acid oxidase-like deaminating enzyme
MNTAILRLMTVSGLRWTFTVRTETIRHRGWRGGYGAKKLRSGRPIWRGQRARALNDHALVRDIETEVLILGAGITGAVIADVLADAGLKVTVVDRRGAAKGSTAVNTALVQYEIDTPLITLTRKIGKEKAVRAWRRSRLAVDALAARLGELKLESVVRRDSLYLSGNVLDQQALLREHQARLAVGLPSRFLSRKALREQFGIVRAAAVCGYGNLVIDPRKTTLALLKAATGNGARVYAPVDIVDIRIRKGGVTATATNARAIECRHLVFATGYELPKHVPRRHHKITSTWAIATVPQASGRLWPGECCL